MLTGSGADAILAGGVRGAVGVVARAVSRLITITSGLDPHGLGVPEIHWMRQSGDYRAAARGFDALSA